MAGASMKDIKLRIKSVESTMQITKAMELVASSKLRKAKEREERCRPYYLGLKEALLSIESATNEFSSPFQQPQPVNKRCVIVIAGDRGLAGGYNSNVLKLVKDLFSDEKATCYLPIGKKAVDFLVRKKEEVITESFSEVSELSIPDTFAISKLIVDGYMNHEYDEVVIIYTKFISMLNQMPVMEKLLPLGRGESESEQLKTVKPLVIYEPNPVAVYHAIVPNYLAGMIYGAICESVASELGARRTAMDAASKNAAEMINELSLHYNRARQAAITQEITEIVAGAEH